MKFTKKSIVLAGLMMCIFLSGCAFFAAAGKKLSTYCPGLNVSLTGVNMSINGGREVTVLDYGNSWQKKVNIYFTDKANGYTGGNQRRYQDLKADDDALVADGDSILSKTIDKNNKTATVIYNVSTRRIIIVEESDK